MSTDIGAAFNTATEAMIKREQSPSFNFPQPAPQTPKKPLSPDQNDENIDKEAKPAPGVANDGLLKPTTVPSAIPPVPGFPGAMMTPASPLFPSPTTVFSPLATASMLPRVPPLTNNAFWQQMMYNNLLLSMAANQQRLTALAQSASILTPSPSTPRSASSAYSFSSVESLARSDAVPSPREFDTPKRRTAAAAGPTTPATGKELRIRVRCPTCGKAFTRPWLLQNHMRVHTGEKPYACDTCGKTFADKSNLRAHTQTHSGVKPFSCTRCGKSFALKAYLSKHEESACAKGRRRTEY